MEPGGPRRRRRRAHTADEAAAVLRKAWCRLRLSARDPARVLPWDAVVLTAASPEQAALYDCQLTRAASAASRPQPPSSPSRTLTSHASALAPPRSTSSPPSPATSSPSLPRKRLLNSYPKQMVLLQMNPMGKAFLPVPSFGRRQS